jgi:HK97 family phage major capsid protein
MTKRVRPEDLDDAEELDIKSELSDIGTMIKSAVDNANKADTERRAAIAELQREVKAAGDIGLTKEKLDKIVTDMAASAAELQSLKAAQNAIEAAIARPNLSPDDKKGDDLVEKDAWAMAEAIHYAKNPTGTFERKSIKIDDMKKSIIAQNQMWRIPGRHVQMETGLDSETVKALSTLSTEGGFWVRPEMSSRIIMCQAEFSEILDLFSQMSISSQSVVMMTENDETVDDTAWGCEVDCVDVPGRLTPPGMVELMAYDLFSSFCVTHRMVEDSAIDIEAYILRRVGRKFARKLTPSFATGDGANKPLGFLDARNGFASQLSGSVPLTPSGQWTWQDLVMLLYSLNGEYQSNATWLMNRLTLAQTLTMTDNDGKPIWSPQVIQQGGVPQILGRPIRIVTQMPNAEVGSKPIAVGDWKEAYTIVNRLGLTTIRDAITMAKCGIKWTFRQRIGGGSTCALAARFLQIV